MKQIALTLAALGVLGVVTNRASAEGALSYPMAAHVAAKYGIHHPGHNRAVQHQEVRHFRRGHHGYHGHYGHGPAFRPHYRAGYAPVVIPYRQPYYISPYYGFRYYGPRFSIGIGF